MRFAHVVYIFILCPIVVIPVIRYSRLYYVRTRGLTKRLAGCRRPGEYIIIIIIIVQQVFADNEEFRSVHYFMRHNVLLSLFIFYCSKFVTHVHFRRPVVASFLRRYLLSFGILFSGNNCDRFVVIG